VPTKEAERLSAQTLRLFVPNYGPLAGRDVYRRHIIAGERAEAEGIATLTASQNARVEDLLLAHTPAYVEALRSGQPADLASTGGEWFLGSIDVWLSVLGAFLDAIDSALTDGVAGMLGGGGHHAYPDHGGALSPVNDMAIGVHHLRRRGIRRVLLLDLDAHFGNGTAASCPNDPDLFLFDFHGHASDFWHPDTPHLFRNFRDEPDARLYLQALQKDLPGVLGEFRPEACLYAAGMDVFSGTPNPPLRLRVPDIEKREAFVFGALSSRHVPVAYVHAGGYASLETLTALHLITARAAHRALSQ
jgi:acetoin utilization deacetylase AcuC-like enzyme